jgi:hypothetical protein
LVSRVPLWPLHGLYSLYAYIYIYMMIRVLPRLPQETLHGLYQATGIGEGAERRTTAIYEWYYQRQSQYSSWLGLSNHGALFEVLDCVVHWAHIDGNSMTPWRDDQGVAPAVPTNSIVKLICSSDRLGPMASAFAYVTPFWIGSSGSVELYVSYVSFLDVLSSVCNMYIYYWHGLNLL